MNSLMGMFGQGNNNLMMQAFGAMMRGESPKQFLQGLAKTNPALQGLNLDNLQQTAQQVCNSNGVNMDDKIKEIQSYLPK